MKYPKLTFLLVGFLMGGNISYFSFSTADIYKERVKSLEAQIIKEKSEYRSLKEENKALKSRFQESYEQILQPDGTRITRRKTDSSEESSQQSRTIVLQNKTIETLKLRLEDAERRSERRKLTLGIGVTSVLDLNINGSYSLIPPFGISAGMDLDVNNPSNIKELQIGINWAL